MSRRHRINNNRKQVDVYMLAEARNNGSYKDAENVNTNPVDFNFTVWSANYSEVASLHIFAVRIQDFKNSQLVYKSSSTTLNQSAVITSLSDVQFTQVLSVFKNINANPRSANIARDLGLSRPKKMIINPNAMPVSPLNLSLCRNGTDSVFVIFLENNNLLPPQRDSNIGFGGCNVYDM